MLAENWATTFPGKRGRQCTRKFFILVPTLRIFFLWQNLFHYFNILNIFVTFCGFFPSFCKINDSSIILLPLTYSICTNCRDVPWHWKSRKSNAFLTLSLWLTLVKKIFRWFIIFIIIDIFSVLFIFSTNTIFDFCQFCQYIFSFLLFLLIIFSLSYTLLSYWCLP